MRGRSAQGISGQWFDIFWSSHGIQWQWLMLCFLSMIIMIVSDIGTVIWEHWFVALVMLRIPLPKGAAATVFRLDARQVFQVRA